MARTAADRKLAEANRRFELALDEFRDSREITFDYLAEAFSQPQEYRGISVAVTHADDQTLVLYSKHQPHSGVGPHKHDCEESICVIRGELHVDNGARHKLTAGSQITIPRGKVHRVWSEGACEVITTLRRITA